MNETHEDRYHSGRIKFWGETIGLHPFRLRMQQAKIAIRGEEDVPASRYNLGSLKQLRPGIGIPLWLGKQKVKNKVIITNCFNHLQTPIEDGWSVKVTQTRDFRGKNLTYDSHNGTDLSVPIGTKLLAAAAGKVFRTISEFNRGGLKVYIDHGNGLVTCSAHLARSLVREGDRVERGQVIAITGYSGLDSLITFPWGTPHTHFNTWLNGEPVDPFPHDGKASLWRAGDTPKPFQPGADGEDRKEVFSESLFVEEHVKEVVAACLTRSARERLQQYTSLYARAGHTIAEMNYYPTRFPVRKNMYTQEYPRTPTLDLPFDHKLFDGVVFSDEI
jgi:murein DD-endopeptidase MepM/ murein hydrolase activator NlpD